MAYRQNYEFEPDAPLSSVPLRTWFQISFAIAIAAGVVATLGSWALESLIEYSYAPNSDGPPPSVLELLKRAITFGFWMFVLNLLASPLAYSVLALVRRLRR